MGLRPSYEGGNWYTCHYWFIGCLACCWSSSSSRCRRLRDSSRVVSRLRGTLVLVAQEGPLRVLGDRLGDHTHPFSSVVGFVLARMLCPLHIRSLPQLMIREYNGNLYIGQQGRALAKERGAVVASPTTSRAVKLT